MTTKIIFIPFHSRFLICSISIIVNRIKFYPLTQQIGFCSH